MRKIITLLICLFVLSGCNGPVRIEQDVEVDSRIDCTYKVKTYLWYGIPGEIEKMFYKYNVPKHDVEDEKARQMDKILPYKEQLEQALEIDCP